LINRREQNNADDVMLARNLIQEKEIKVANNLRKFESMKQIALRAKERDISTFF
jgi:hypothetical protein